MVPARQLDFFVAVIRYCSRFAGFQVFGCPKWNGIGNTEGKHTKLRKTQPYMKTAILIMATLFCFGLLRKTIDWFETI